MNNMGRAIGNMSLTSGPIKSSLHPKLCLLGVGVGKEEGEDDITWG